MTGIHGFIEKLKRPLFAQILFILLAFIGIIIVSYVFSRNIVRTNLIKNTENVLTFGQAKLEADLSGPRTMLDFISEIVRDMILEGESVDTLQGYFSKLAGYFNRESGSDLGSNFNGFYGYFETLGDEPVFIDSLNRELPDDFSPRTLPWYQAAILAGNRIAVTYPYLNSDTGEISFAYTRRIFDNAGLPLGIVCLDVRINDTLEYIVETALAQGGFGMLLGQDLTILAHPNKDFVGLNGADPAVNFSIFINELRAGQDVYEGNLTNYRGEPAVAFFRRLPNGFYMGLVTAKAQYYQSVTTMAIVLIVFGALLAAGLTYILNAMIRINAAREKSDMQSVHKSAFLANMSHEIRTPMNAIIGMTQIAKASGDPERMHYCLKKIDDASNHLLGVINDILDMSKIEANKFELSPAEFNFEKMLQRVVNVVNFRVDEKHQNLTVHIDRHIPKLLIADDQRVAQVITNLLGNAVKFTPEHGSISLNARHVEETNGLCTLQISVSDTGIGITPEQQKRLFISFEQAESSTTRKFGGTGLGLAISKSIVEMMGGRIWVESEAGKGSTFSFTIQVQRGAEVHKGPLSPDVNLHTVRIMVVDDDKAILDYFGEIAREFKVQCDVAASGEEALRLLQQNGRYHIYFVDWKMPGMDGIQLAAELKKLHGSSESVVIMITAAEWTTIEGDARKAGVDKFLSKPLFPSLIADAINEAIGIDREGIEEAQVNIDGIFAGRRVLLAEDMEINREIVKALLEPTQLEIDCADNGAEAVDMFGKDPVTYDLVLMDVQMPEMDGLQATRLIRALELPHAKETPIIAMTANVFREDIEKCLEAGMNDHVGKPLDFDEVLVKLRRYLPPKNNG